MPLNAITIGLICLAAVVHISAIAAEPWIADSQFDPVIGDDPFVEVTNIKAQSDNKILIIGEFASVNGVRARNVARLNPNGSTDAEFSAKQHLDGFGNSLTIDPIGRILVCGLYSNIAGIKRPGIARLLPSGDVDQTFSPTIVSSGIEGALVQTDGRILVFGSIREPPGAGRPSVSVVRLFENGSTDTSFSFSKFHLGSIMPKLTGFNFGAAIQSNGKILMIGTFNSIDNLDPLWTIRLNPDGSFDDSFQTPVPTSEINFIEDLRLLPNDRFVTLAHGIVYQWQMDGQIITPPIYAENTVGDAINVADDGGVLYGSRTTIRKYSADQTLQWEAGSPAVSVASIIMSPDRSILIGGRTLFGAKVWKFKRGALTYDIWRTRVFDANAPRTDPFESFRDDGIPNFAWYAIGGDPRSSWTSPIRPLPDGSVWVHFAEDAPDVSLHLERTVDLASGDWEEIASRPVGASEWLNLLPKIAVTKHGPTEISVSDQNASTSFFTLRIRPGAALVAAP